MATSKLTTADAQEWLESLQQVGEGWYRQVALAIRANAHKELGMSRREFAQSIGQRMIDPQNAIVELHKEGHSRQAIADVLGVSHHTVHNALVAEGLVDGLPRPSGGREYQTTAPSHDDSAETTAPSHDGDIEDAEFVDVEPNYEPEDVEDIAAAMETAEASSVKVMTEFFVAMDRLHVFGINQLVENATTKERRKWGQRLQADIDLLQVALDLCGEHVRR